MIKRIISVTAPADITLRFDNTSMSMAEWVMSVEDRLRTTAQATQIAPTEDNRSDAGLCNCPEGKCLIAWDAPVPRNCRAASMTPTIQASSQSATKTDDAGRAEPGSGCVSIWGHDWLTAGYRVGWKNDPVMHCRFCDVWKFSDKILVPLVQSESSTSAKPLSSSSASGSTRASAPSQSASLTEPWNDVPVKWYTSRLHKAIRLVTQEKFDVGMSQTWDVADEVFRCMAAKDEPGNVPRKTA